MRDSVPYASRLGQRPGLESATLNQTSIEIYKLYREKVVHEDTLINFRVSWFVALQGFLGSTMVVLFASKELVASWKLLLGLETIGLVIAVLTVMSVKAAMAAIDRVGLKWRFKYVDVANNRYLDRGVRDIVDPVGLLPAVKGAGSDETIARFGSSLSYWLPLSVALVWLGLIGWSGWSLYMEAGAIDCTFQHTEQADLISDMCSAKFGHTADNPGPDI